MTPSAIVAIMLGVAVLVYFTATATFTFIHPGIASIERFRMSNDLMAVMIGGLIVFMSRNDK